MNINIKQTKPNDNLWSQVAELFPRAVQWMNDPSDDGGYHFFAAIDDSTKFLGGSVIEIGTLRFGPLSGVKAGFLENIHVLEPHRRKGVAVALLCATLQHAWQMGCESVRSVVTYDNTAAIAFYRNQGFGFVPEEDPAAEQPEKTYAIVAINPARVKAEYACQPAAELDKK